jgi:hypothetical protein
LGKLLVTVPDVDSIQTNWALPCTPYAGPGVGMLFLPPVGALVWVEFEGDDPNYPIWVGCFWRDAADVPIAYGRNAEDPAKVKVLKTDSTTIVIDDTADTGEVMVTIVQPAVTTYAVTLTLFSQGAKLETGVCTITVEPAQGITSTVSETTIVETPGAITATATQITANTEPSRIQMTGASVTIASPQLTATIDAATSVTSGEGITLTAAEITATAASTALTTVLEVTGASNFTGAVAVEGAVNIAGALVVEGGADFAGGVAIEGGGVIDGLPII